jgi:exonuclease VII small subunit
VSVTDYDKLRQSAVSSFAAKAAEVRATVAKLERAQRKGETALELFERKCIEVSA